VPLSVSAEVEAAPDFVFVSPPELESVVKAPDPGVPEPIAPGDAKVAPFNDEAFKFATLVVELTTSGAVPLDTVETSCPETESEEPVAAPILGVVRVGPVPKTTLPVPVAPAAVTPPIEILVPKVCSPLQACAMLVSAICPVLAGRVAVTVPSAPATGSSVTRPEVAFPW